jgi:serine/threonine protein kinase
VDPIHNDALLSLGYEPLALLGSGGMGRVWRARERSLERDVAIKLLAATELRDRQRERFLLEARALARIQHPNVVVVYRLGEVLGVPFLAYELID